MACALRLPETSTRMPALLAAAPARHSALISETDEALVCPSCESAMKLTPNPYFGTGLAEHRTIALCTGCQHIAFIPEPEKPILGLADRVADMVRALLGRRG